VMWQNNEEEEEEEVRSMIGKYTVHTAGIWELHVKYHDVLTFGSPFSVTVVAAEPEPERCIVSGAGIKTIDPSSTTQTFQIQLMDQHGNVCGSDQYTNDIVGIMYTEQDVLPCNVEYKGAGVYALSYESNTGIVEEGGGEIQVSIGGVEVNDSPYTVTIGPNNSEQLNILLSKRLSVEDMANRGFMISPNKEEEQSHSAASSPPSSPSMSVRRDSLMQKMATRETVQALVERGILGPSAMVEQVAPANKNHRGVGKMIQQEAGHSPAYSSGSLWANAGNTQIIHTMDTNNSPNGGLNKEEVISMVQQTATRTKATLDRRPGPWASVAELLAWLPPRRMLVEEMLTPLLKSLQDESMNGTRGIGYSPWKHLLLEFSKKYFEVVVQNTTSSPSSNASPPTRDPQWDREEERLFCKLHENLELSGLPDPARTTMCDVMNDYIEVQRQVMATASTTRNVWAPGVSVGKQQTALIGGAMAATVPVVKVVSETMQVPMNVLFGNLQTHCQ
jgi:hypothetical protein